MASPMPFQPQAGWNHNGQAMPHPNANPSEESGVQVRPAGLKILYKFNKDDKFDCLARPSQTFNVQTIPIDEKTTIGVVDLRLCIQAVIDCSPELPGHQSDYTIYAHDYSEDDTPLVGQGMLSAALHSMHHDMGGQSPKMVTGLITRNKLGALMGNANKEILEIKMKFTETPRVQAPPPSQQMQPQTHPHIHQQHQQHQPHQQHQQQPQSQAQAQTQQHYQPHHQHQFQHSQDAQRHEDMFQPAPRPMDGSMTPTSTAEWSSFMQSNPQIGQAPAMSRGASPALSQGPSNMGHGRRDSFSQALQPQPQAQPQSQPQLQPMPPVEIPRVAPVPVEPASDANPAGPSSRPSSRASNRAPRKRGPTGRPRGRPRKTAPPEGNTSGYEDGTEGEDGPVKKRVKTTKVDKVNTNPFGAEPESLRVAASTSGSLRNFRPLAISGEGVTGNHLQEVPRAPTPVPIAPFPGKSAGKTAPRQSALSRETSTKNPSPQAQKTRALSPSQEDGRSPESLADTPAYSEGSPADIGSSPPVPRTTSFMQSSPPPSSPMLPPMPQQPASQDDGLENDDLCDLFGEDPPQPEPEKKAASVGPGRKPRQSSNIPMQVWRMKDGPDGNQDMVHVRSYNTPEPTSGPASDNASRPRRSYAQIAPAPVPRPLPNSHHPYYHPGPVPTPPQTTDAPEKPTSPPIDEAQPDAPPTETQPPNHPSEQAVAEQITQPPFPDSVAEPPQPSIENANEQDEAQRIDKAPEPAMTGEDNSVEDVQAESKEKGDPTKEKNAGAPAKPRKLARSHSAGALALPLVPASEPVGPSSLSQSFTAELEQPAPPTASAGLRRAASSGPTGGVPASDPVGPSSAAMPSSNLILPVCPPSEPAQAAPSSPDGDRSNKNEVKKNAIKQRLEAAILRGEMPPFCSNCGAIETPTWRKIYSQEHEGIVPQYKPGELSTRPGMVTIVQQLPQTSEDAPQKYRITKKTLGPEEDKTEWQEDLLCNPCGIWLAKSLTHRPADRWNGDAARLGQNRKRRSGDSNGPRPKRVRTKSNPQATSLTSEMNIPTDAPEPVEPSSVVAPSTSRPATRDESAIQENDATTGQDEFRPRSTHSNGSGTAKSPVNLEFEEAMGTTKRLLFPSPRKDDSPKTLGELSVNIAHTSTGGRYRKDSPTAKENLAVPEHKKAAEGDELEDLFRSPMPPRPSTPTSNTKAAPPTTPFKTPTRATPNHRPITRSVSRSMKSKDSLGSPANIQHTPSQTPSKTLRDFGLAAAGSSVRRSPRNHNAINFDDCIFDTPVSRAVNQMLSETNFGLDDEMDLVNLNTADSDAHWATFSSYFSTDAPMPSSPPKEQLGFSEEPTATDWEHLHMEKLMAANNETE